MAGLTQKQLAERLRLTMSAATQWVIGHTLPRAFMISKISLVLGVFESQVVGDNHGLGLTI